MIAIIDYNAGNLKSVEKALHFLGEDCVITRNFHEIETADSMCWTDRFCGFRISRDLRFRTSGGILCIYRMTEDFLLGWRKIRMYILYIPII